MATTKSDTLNYRGELFLVGQYQTPFLSALGASRIKRSNSFVFPMAQPWSLTAASQPAITEDASITAGTPTTVTRSEDTNTAQIFKYDYAVSFKKQSQFGLMSGINTNDPNPVTDELTFQKVAALRQMAIDMEYTFLNGAYQAASSTATAAKTRGLVAGITTNATAAGGAALTKGLIDSTLQTMFGNGAPFQDVVLIVNAFQRRALSQIYGYAPMDRNIGGLSIKQIETDFGTFGIMLDTFAPTDTVVLAEMSVMSPVFVPVSLGTDGRITDVSFGGVDVLNVETPLVAAAKGGFIYSQAGLDYGPEKYSGKITGLATS